MKRGLDASESKTCLVFELVSVCASLVRTSREIDRSSCRFWFRKDREERKREKRQGSDEARVSSQLGSVL